jgi:gliding motility-associated-like protein
MKYTLLTLLISMNLMAQTTYELCDTYIQKEIRANTSASNTDWSVNPLVPYQVSDDVMTITIKDIGTYIITATFSNGLCYTKDQLVLTIIECKESFLWIPNSFTPNDDRTNDTFGAYGINIKDFELTIWNRWGELLFISNDLNNRWDGTYKGKVCQDDVYTYKLSYKDVNNKQYTKFGRVTLFK